MTYISDSESFCVFVEETQYWVGILGNQERNCDINTNYK